MRIEFLRLHPRKYDDDRIVVMRDENTLVVSQKGKDKDRKCKEAIVSPVVVMKPMQLPLFVLDLYSPVHEIPESFHLPNGLALSLPRQRGWCL